MGKTFWQEVPLGSRIEQDKHPLNLSPEEVITLQDLTPNRVRESLALRKTSNIISDIPVNGEGVLRIGEQNRPDGTRVLVIVADVGNGDRRLYVKSPVTNEWRLIGDALGAGAVDLEVSPDAIRACGEDGLSTVMKLRTIPYTTGGVPVMPRKFFSSNGPQAEEVAGVGYVKWDGKVTNFVPRVQEDENNNPVIPNDPGLLSVVVTAEAMALDNEHIDRRRGQDSQREENLPVSSSFGTGDLVRYFLTLTYEGGQESVPVYVSNVRIQGTANLWVLVKVYVYFPYAFNDCVKRINIYRDKRTGEFSDFSDVTSLSSSILIASFPIYKEKEGNDEWQSNSNIQLPAAVISIVDENESSIIGGTYFDRQQLSHEVTYLSPNSKRQAMFQDRRIIWQLVEEDGSINGNVLGYSHTNGIGIPCYDIIPPANRIPMPFNVLGVVAVRSHRIIIGDSKYSIGYFGGSIERWSIYEGETEIGCKSEDSIADTPFGAAYVGYDGIYLVSGFDISQPYARGIIKATSETHDWTRSKGVFAQNEQEYVVLVPVTAGTRGDPMIVAISFRTGATRMITVPSPDVSAIGTDSSGFVFLGTNRGIYRLEFDTSEPDTENPEDEKTPIVETGYRRFFGTNDYQHVTKVGIHGTCTPGRFKVTLTGYPSGTESVLLVGKNSTNQFKSSDNPGHDTPDHAHKVKIEYQPNESEKPTAFQIDRLFVRGKSVEDRVLP